ncbi:hypothetical protein [Mycobacterium sp. E740]|uniref:hypothetical protein n=1 Tax=Mycobacterium sp. E740 TaxID=1834149 RepID=UPI000AAC1728|nr:hypothetical protein [Mycobacterium sp. E740]
MTGIDAVVAAIEPELATPEVEILDVVLVTGPRLAGSTSVVEALRKRLPDHTFVEADELGRKTAPAAVVFVVSAVAAMTESDRALLDSAARNTDVVVGVVSKIDTHRDWRDGLAADRAMLTARTPRYARVPWVGAAAAPDLGEVHIDELVDLLRARLADPELNGRNRLRAWETRIRSEIDRCHADAEDERAAIAALQRARDDLLRARRHAKSERVMAMKSEIQRARVQLGYFARNCCTSLRTELADDAAQLSRSRLGEFEAHTRERAGALIATVEEAVATHLTAITEELDLTAPSAPEASVALEFPPPPLRSRRLERQLTMILGAGFGLGVALAVTRLFTGLTSEFAVAGLVVGGLAGLALTLWVVHLRGLLHDRAVLERWATEVTGMVKSRLEERVATRVLAAEAALASDLAVRDEREAATARAEVGQIDAELRAHAARATSAAAVRERRLPSLRGALDAVQVELDRSNTTKPTSESFL